jgi:hypothetical protein
MKKHVFQFKTKHQLQKLPSMIQDDQLPAVLHKSWPVDAAEKSNM